MSEVATNRVDALRLSGGLSPQQVEELKYSSTHYPYFVLPRLALLAHALQENSDDFEQQLHESALYAYDRKQVLLQLNQIESRWLNHTHTPPSKDKGEKKDATQSLIDSFLNNYEDKNPIQVEPSVIFTPAVDYSVMLSEKADAPTTEKEKEDIALIDSFIQKANSNEFLLHPDKEEEKEQSETKNSSRDSKEEILSLLAVDDSFLTESLAKIYIKQKRYSKALEIIKKLSLKYPEKNVYFADQIRFLEKLITNINLK